ncbi:hypothetical protein IFM89_034385 [Coptis chinensis]|uniref:Uncharacterized protein n=1 Tax=Coptis chinensis TaxID=261450 RepID=A0A835IZW4_9MAGN|nr:hypothetical protein IFM89_034385 [Coptis chinensis]
MIELDQRGSLNQLNRLAAICPDFPDLQSLVTFEFRGEALSSLCALGNIRKEYAKLISLLNAYAHIAKGVRLVCNNNNRKERKKLDLECLHIEKVVWELYGCTFAYRKSMSRLVEAGHLKEDCPKEERRVKVLKRLFFVAAVYLVAQYARVEIKRLEVAYASLEEETTDLCGIGMITVVRERSMSPQSYRLRLAHNPLVLRSSFTSSFEIPWHRSIGLVKLMVWLPASDYTHFRVFRHVVIPILDRTSFPWAV